MEIQYDDPEIFRNNFSTFKETSLDKDENSKEYMTDSQIKVVDFDGVKEDYIRHMKLPSTPCSNDALYISEAGRYTFVEFKNGKMSKQKVYNVYNKIYDSLLIFNDIISQNISFCRENVDFILVYNEAKNMIADIGKEEDRQEVPSRAVIGKYFSRKAKRKFVRFNMEKFEKIYFREVFTYTEKEFEEKFLSKLTSSDER